MSSRVLVSVWVLLGLLSGGNNSARCESFPPVQLPAEGKLPARLSELNLFRDIAQTIPNEGVVYYDLCTPHFADYAKLDRYMWLPPGTSIRYEEGGDLTYPVGAALVLVSSYPGDFRQPDSTRDIVELRVFVYRGDEWISGQYAFDETTGDANLVQAGGAKHVRWIHGDGTAREHKAGIPNRVQCAMCHEIDGKFTPLGPMNADNLNREMNYDGETRNQLAHLKNIGYLVGAPAPEDAPRMAVWDDPESGDLNERARAYLAVNCSSCHRPGGLAYTSGLDLSIDQIEPTKFGIYKAPVAAGRGGVGRFAVIPGDPDGSIMIHRMEATDPGVRMPVVGRDLVHEEGLALIREWIEQLEYPELADEQNRQDGIQKTQLNFIEKETTGSANSAQE